MTVGRQRPAVLGAAVLVLLAVLALVAPAPARASGPPLPSRMAALGDSITRGFNACGWYVDCPSRSWSTGSSPGVDSHYLRVLARHPAIAGHQLNDARSGARMAALPSQAATAVTQRADYVTVLVGANDACTGSVSTMTAVSTYESRFRAAMRTLAAGLPHALVFVSSVPNVKRLWSIGKGSWAARQAWSTYDICQSLLARPLSTKPADVDRRNRVRQRVVAYNAVLAEVCAEYPSCRFDQGAVFSYPFTLSQLSTWDYFHPNTSGQAALAAVTWKRSFWS